MTSTTDSHATTAPDGDGANSGAVALARDCERLANLAWALEERSALVALRAIALIVGAAHPDAVRVHVQCNDSFDGIVVGAWESGAGYVDDLALSYEDEDLVMSLCWMVRGEVAAAAVDWFTWDDRRGVGSFMLRGAVEHTDTPAVHVLVDVSSDGGVALDVLGPAGSIPQRLVHQIDVDPGRGWSAGEWEQARQEAVAAVPAGCRAQVSAAFEAVQSGSVTTESMTPEQVDDELRRLAAQLGMPVARAEHLAEADALDADLYQVLRRIRDLRWLQSS